MSIASEITRLQTAKADIKTAIEAKGVTVPANAKLDDYDTYVASIPTGGGGTNYLEQYLNNSLSGALNSTQLGIISVNNFNIPYFLSGYNSITSVDLSDSTFTNLSGESFGKQSSLTSVILPATCTTIGNNFLDSCANITSFTIPSSVTNIGGYFLNNTGITTMTVPATVTSIGSDVFSNCNNLTSVIFNAQISNLPVAFCKITNNLTLVDLNSSVTSISYYSFGIYGDSTNLLEVVLRRTDDIVTVANAIGSTNYNSAFAHRQNIKVYVPSALKATYEANANWAAGVTAGYLTFVNLEGSIYE